VEVTFSLPRGIPHRPVIAWSEERTIPLNNHQFRDVFRMGDLRIYTTAKERQPSKALEFLKDPAFAEIPSYEPVEGNLAAVQTGAVAQTSRRYINCWHEYYAHDSDPHTCWFPLYEGTTGKSWANPPWDNPTGTDAPWLEITFPEKKNVGRIVVKSYRPKHWNDPPCHLQDYDLHTLDGTETWRTLVEVRGNQEEVVTHPFEPVATTKIRLLARRGLFLSELEAYEK
jgi:hypothetical protein